MLNEFVKFIAIGALAAFANWLSRFSFSTFSSIEIAIVLAYLVGMTVAYSLWRVFVFPNSIVKRERQMLRFAIVNAVAFVQVWVVTVALIRFAVPYLGMEQYGEAMAHAVGVGSTTVTSYLAHKYFTFE